MASWRDLVMQQSRTIEQNSRRNPGLESLGKLMDMSMSSKMNDKKMAKQHEYAKEISARTATYKQYPQLAAKDAGFDTSNLPIDDPMSPIDRKRVFSVAEDMARGDLNLMNFESVPIETLKKYIPAAEKFLSEGVVDSVKPEESTESTEGKEEMLPKIEPRATGLGRIGRGAEYKDAVQKYGEESTDQILGIVQDLERKGKSIDQIADMMRSSGWDPELFLKFYR